MQPYLTCKKTSVQWSVNQLLKQYAKMLKIGRIIKI